MTSRVNEGGQETMNVENKCLAPVVVVGGGLAGLTAAVSLARDGVPVQLYERSHNLGARAQTKNVNGFMLNIGPHALYKKGPAAKFFF